MNQTKMHVVAVTGLAVAIAAAVAMSILDEENHRPIIQALGYTIFGIGIVLIITELANANYRRKSTSITGRMFTAKSLRYAAVWAVPLVGVIGYILVYTGLLGNDTVLKEAVEELSGILVIGGFLGYLTSSSQFLGIFREEVEDIMYSEKSLERRNDINDIWRNVSLVMIGRKFPNINEELFNIIQNRYICKNEYSYQEDYRIITEIRWGDKDGDKEKEIVHVIEDITYMLVTEKIGTVDISFSGWMPGVKGLKKDEDYYFNVPKFTIDGIAHKPQKVEVTENDADYDENIYKVRFVLTIPNDKKDGRFRVTMRRERRFCLKTDFSIGMRTRYIIKDMVISLEMDDDIAADFICRGTHEDFIIVKKTKNRQEYIYKGLILQRQGYIFALRNNT